MKTTRFEQRQATAGTTTVCSARKDRNTLIHWFWVKVGAKWVEFDMRQVAAKYNFVFAATDYRLGLYEQFLCAELQRVANLCEACGYKGEPLC